MIRCLRTWHRPFDYAGHGTKRAMLLGYLAAAERHITNGARHVARQREIVDELERHGRGNSETVKEELLQAYETSQVAHVADRLRFKQAATA